MARLALEARWLTKCDVLKGTYAFSRRHGGKGCAAAERALVFPLRGPLVLVSANGILQSSIIVASSMTRGKRSVGEAR
jgi:hypothetical protein